MASRQFNTPGVLGIKRRKISGRFYPAGTGAVTYNKPESQGVTPSRTGVGTYLLTLDDPFHKLVAAKCSLQLSTAADLNLQFGDVSNLGTNSPVTIVLRAVAAGVATDIAADANNSISFELEFEDSSALDG